VERTGRRCWAAGERRHIRRYHKESGEPAQHWIEGFVRELLLVSSKLPVGERGSIVRMRLQLPFSESDPLK
jgi:hypothetical protein